MFNAVRPIPVITWTDVLRQQQLSVGLCKYRGGNIAGPGIIRHPADSIYNGAAFPLYLIFQ